MLRIFYAIKESWKYRQAIGEVRHSPQQAIACLCDLTPSDLQALGIEHLALDFDGVMGAHGEQIPCLAVQQWLEQFCQQWPAEQISILSNKPLKSRLFYFQRHFPGISMITGFPKKPYPKGLEHIVKQSGLRPEQVALVDDRLLTGILAACICGVKGIYIHKPYARLWRRPIQESFFALLRGIERGVWWPIGRSKLSDQPE